MLEYTPADDIWKYTPAEKILTVSTKCTPASTRYGPGGAGEKLFGCDGENLGAICATKVQGEAFEGRISGIFCYVITKIISRKVHNACHHGNVKTSFMKQLKMFKMQAGCYDHQI